MDRTERFRKEMDILDKYELGSSGINHEILRKLKDEEFDNEDKIREAIEKITAYYDRVENNTNKYSEDIMKYLRQREGLDKYDTSKDDELNKLTPNEAFKEVVNWNNLIGGWDITIKDWVKSIYGVDLDEIGNKS